VFRDRFGKYHAGEDWWGPNRRSSFGRPVYSIGHGLVTYAEPEGWNRDKGVIIIQHTLADGAAILSFYGHLDPPSVVVQAGHCVARGEQIGQIGRPRGSPHLHFEIRTHSPYAPLTGYWPEDPTLVGWLPPSQIIWHQRIASAAGVQWTRPFVAGGTEGIGVVNGDTLIALEEGQLIGLDLANGSLRWRYASVDDVSSALLDARASVIYVAGRSGWIEALSLLDSQGAVATAATVPAFALLWQVELDVVGAPTLLPLAGGGVGVSVGRHLFGLAPDGTLLWARDSLGQPITWALAGDHLIVATTSQDSPLWQIGEAGPQVWGASTWRGPANSRPVVANGQVWPYGRDGVYRLNPETQAAELQYALPQGLLSLGDMVALPDGGVLVAHADNFDRRLIALNGDGTLRWQRSYAQLIAGSQHLLTLGGEILLVAQDESGHGQLSIFIVDMASAELTLIFTGGTRSSISTDIWLLSDGRSRLIINIGGGHMLALDVAQARSMVAP
jgi:murein DD-endopeptidase MepM/ murein hydrolase activator NlpD